MWGSTSQKEQTYFWLTICPIMLSNQGMTPSVSDVGVGYSFMASKVNIYMSCLCTTLVIPQALFPLTNNRFDILPNSVGLTVHALWLLLIWCIISLNGQWKVVQLSWWWISMMMYTFLVSIDISFCWSYQSTDNIASWGSTPDPSKQQYTHCWHCYLSTTIKVFLRRLSTIWQWVPNNGSSGWMSNRT